MKIRGMKTRNILRHDPRPFPVARKIAKRVLREDKEFRRAKRPCPCGFDCLLYARTGGNIWCTSCGLMVPADSVCETKTGRKAEF